MLYICGGLMRTGSVAMWQIMSELAMHTGNHAPRLGTKLHDVINLWRKTRLENSLTVTKLHFWEDELEPCVGEIKVVLTIRDLRDVTVSLMHYSSIDFNTLIQGKAFKTWVDNYNSWYRHVPNDRILEVHYEDFISDRQETIARVATFMGVDLDAESIGHIDNKWSIAANIQRAQEKHPTESRDYMSSRHIYSRGQSLWQQELTPEQVAYVMQDDRLEWMKAHGYVQPEFLEDRDG